MATKKDAPYAAFAQKLTELRKNAKMTRADLAAECGVAASTIINYENGTRIPYADTAYKMAQTFNISVEELLGVQNPELAMVQAEGLDLMRSINGKKGEDRLQATLAEAENLAGGDLSDEQLMEFSMQLQRVSLMAQQRLNERFTNRKYQASVEAKAEATAKAVQALNDAIAQLTSGDNQ